MPSFSLEELYSFTAEPKLVEPNGAVVFSIHYKNLSTSNHCLSSDDITSKGLLSGVLITKNGSSIERSKWVSGARSLNAVNIAIIRPEQEVKLLLNLAEDFNFYSNENYELNISIPVSNCEYLLRNSIGSIPSSYDIATIDEGRLSGIELPISKKLNGIFPNWSQYGFIASMEEHTFNVGH